VSIAALHNRLLRDHPEYLEVLCRPFYYAHLGGDLPTLSPLLSFHDGKLACRYLRQYIELGHEIMGVSLSQIEIEALDAVDSITHDPTMCLDMTLEPGDIQFANNYMVMHSRASFLDHKDPTQQRKKLRLWLRMHNARSLAADFPGRNGFD
jgi:alpha-ketoglutarate-dependent taurine dioxygenase